ncbi:carbohydrate esterase [Picosynechococcus sp. PCC 7003]|uniref:alpha/beta hydrolase n=1 Tax=Picosynechococcus sp. PCC 7003 TaxID=374981 RepID=UPI000810781A|nr:alpha/beta hydrolase-fold protein [Picosynechococcus sp. PCC 7003]ANV83513.1 carbohydrate esterase [Picosynechococcus sp. PCC 7003]
MAEEFYKGGQRAWFHDQGHWGGFFHTYDQLHLKGFGAYFDQPRKIHVFLPRDYEVTGYRLPVVYCNDGDKIFFADGDLGQCWQVAERLSRMYLREQLQKLIVVAVCPGDRHYEYSHVPDQGGGLGDYSRYLAKGLKPFIDAQYRTQADQTLIVGAGHGGLAAFYTATQHPCQFPQVAALSPSFWLGLEANPILTNGLEGAFKLSLENSALVFAATAALSNPELRPKIYLDWGLMADANHREVRARLRGQEMRELLIRAFQYQENVNLFTLEDPLGRHDELSWGDRLETILQLFF